MREPVKLGATRAWSGSWRRFGAPPGTVRENRQSAVGSHVSIPAMRTHGRSRGERPSFAVLGAGGGGQAVAGGLAYDGFEVALYDRSPSRIAPFRVSGSIALRGAYRGTGELAYAGTDLAAALENREVIIIVTPAVAHRPLAKQIAPLLRDGQIILLMPGRTFGALEVSRVIRGAGCTAEVAVAEADTLLYVARAVALGTVLIKAVKRRLVISAVHACDTPGIADRLRLAFPQIRPARSFVRTSFCNIGARLHPAIALGNAQRILRGDTFDFYTEGITPRVATTLMEVDREFQTVSRVLGARPISIAQWLQSRYSVGIADLPEMLRSNPGYQGIRAPTTLDHRYLWDDIPTGLVPVSEAAAALRLRTPTIDRLIREGSAILDRSFRKEGRTPAGLGLRNDGIRKEIRRIVMREDRTEWVSLQHTHA